jgi:quercetin dioxygenase-like cupin family protein
MEGNHLYMDKKFSMETQTVKPNPSIHRFSKSSAAAFMAFDLPILIEKMKHAPTWSNEELHAEVLLKTPARQIVLTALRAGTEIESYQADHSVTVHVTEGIIKIHTRKGCMTLGQGNVMLIKEKAKYSLISGEDAVLLFNHCKR